MGTTAVDERLDTMRHQIEALESKGRASTGAAKTRIQRQLGTLHQQEASARAAAEQRPDTFDEKFEQFEARFRVAESAVAADLSDNRNEFADAVDDELHRWDTYVERLQAQTALRAASARERAESTISDLRRQRNDIAQRLAAARSASGDTWDEQKQQIGAARDELQRKADEFSANFK
jgi:archaellum component FlaC